MVHDSKEWKILNFWRIGKNGPIKTWFWQPFEWICHLEKLLNQILQFFFFFIDIEFSFLPVFIQSAFENFDFPFHNLYFWSIWLSIYQKEIPRPKSYFYLLSSLKLKVFNPSIFLHRNSVSIILMFLSYSVSGFVINN